MNLVWDKLSLGYLLDIKIECQMGTYINGARRAENRPGHLPGSLLRLQIILMRQFI